MDVPSWGELTGQVLGLMESRLLDPLEILLDSDLCGMRSVAAGRAGALAEDLLGEDDQVAAMTAIRLVAALYPGDGPFDPPASWWLTPLGRITARRAGRSGRRGGVVRGGRGDAGRDPAGGARPGQPGQAGPAPGWRGDRGVGPGPARAARGQP